MLRPTRAKLLQIASLRVEGIVEPYPETDSPHSKEKIKQKYNIVDLIKR